MTLPTKQISIILPSFRDDRIIQAIASIRMFDDISVVRILVIDGGSSEELVDNIRSVLAPDDILITEPDNGIFDALNKGLALVKTPYVGWLGSDDLFTGEVLASHVVEELESTDIFVASLIMFQGNRIKRLTHSYPSYRGLARYGLHNPHYSTFGRAELFQSCKFKCDNISADISYFLDVFEKQPRVSYTRSVSTLQAEGGFSNSSLLKSMSVNKQVYKIYVEHTGRIIGAIAVFLKVSYKVASVLYYKAFPARCSDFYPDLFGVGSSKSNTADRG